jgi:hypothetical protein
VVRSGIPVRRRPAPRRRRGTVDRFVGVEPAGAGVGRSRRAFGSRRTSRGGRPRRSGSRGALPRRGGSSPSSSRVGRLRGRSRVGSAASSSGGRGRRVRDDVAGRRPVRRSAAVERGDRSTACSRRARGRVVFSAASSSLGSRWKADVNLATNPSRFSSVSRVSSTAAYARRDWTMPGTTGPGPPAARLPR